LMPLTCTTSGTAGGTSLAASATGHRCTCTSDAGPSYSDIRHASAMLQRGTHKPGPQLAGGVRGKRCQHQQQRSQSLLVDRSPPQGYTRFCQSEIADRRVSTSKTRESTKVQ
jgi:hypothetical protein